MEKLTKELTFPVCKLDYQEPTTILQSYLQLFGTYAIYQHEFYATEQEDEEYDDDLKLVQKEPKEEVYNYCRSVIAKASITGLDIMFQKRLDLWSVVIIASDKLTMYFETQAAAQALYDQVFEWRFTKPARKKTNENSNS